MLRSLALIAILLAQSASAAKDYTVQRGEQTSRLAGAEGAELTGRLNGADMNRDGILDVVVEHDGGLGVILGGVTWANERDLATAPPEISITTDPPAALALAGWGDLDGDGSRDLIVFSPGERVNGVSYNGPDEVYVYLAADPLPSTSRTADADVVIRLPDRSLWEAFVGDLDTDGLDDVLISRTAAQGQVDVLWGRASWPALVDLTITPADMTITRAPPTGDLALGDVSGDGLPDLAIVCGGNCIGSGTELILGRASWPAVLDQAAGGRLYPVGDDTTSVLIADLTGDGEKDLAVGRRGFREPAEIRIFSGGPGFSTVPTFVMSWPTGHAEVTAAMDFDGDGATDLVGRSPGWWSRTSTMTEVASVFLGPITSSRDGALEPADLMIGGPWGRELVVGDVDGDGMNDVLVGAIQEPAPSAALGAVYAFLSPTLTPHPPAADRFVSPNGSDAADGLSWATARRTLGSALASIDAVPGHARLFVAEGTYRESITMGHDTEVIGGMRPPSMTRPSDARRSVLVPPAGSTTVRLSASDARPSLLNGFILSGAVTDNASASALAVGPGTAHVQSVVIRDNRSDVHPVMGYGCSDPMNPAWTCNPVPSGVGSTITVGLGSSLILAASLIHGNSIRQTAGCGSSWCPDPSFGATLQAESARALSIRTSTITGNPSSPAVSAAAGHLEIRDSILVTGPIDVRRMGSAGSDDVHHSIIGVVQDVALGAGVLQGIDPRFVDAAADDFRLSHVATGHAFDSPAVDAGSLDAADDCLPDPCMDAATTRIDGVGDAGVLDMGFHDTFPRRQAPAFAGLASASPVGDCQAELTWLPASDFEGDPITFEIYSSDTPGNQDFRVPFASVDEPATSALVSGAFGTTRHFVVRARDVAGDTDRNLVEIAVTFGDATPPVYGPFAMLPTITCRLRESSREGTAACSGASRVEFHRSDAPGFVPDATTLVAVNPPFPFTDTLPIAGTYYYRRIITDRAGNVQVSGQVEARDDRCGTPPPPVPPSSPALLLRSAGPGLLTVAATSAGATSFRMHVGTLASLRRGLYDHSVGPGPDGLPGTVDDVGACDLAAGATVPTPSGSGAYLLVTASNAAGSTHDSFDSTGAPAADATTGTDDCR